MSVLLENATNCLYYRLDALSRARETVYPALRAAYAKALHSSGLPYVNEIDPALVISTNRTSARNPSSAQTAAYCDCFAFFISFDLLMIGTPESFCAEGGR
jgi:hypothetical protein